MMRFSFLRRALSRATKPSARCFCAVSFAFILVVLPATVRGQVTRISIGPTRAVGGTTATGTVWLASVATSDQVVYLQSSAPSFANPAVPLVTVEAGQQSAAFTINTYPWYTDAEEHMPVTISSRNLGVAGTFEVSSRVEAPPVLDCNGFGPWSVTGGQCLTIYVKLNKAAPPTGAWVNLASGNSVAATVDPSVYVPPGETQSLPATVCAAGTTSPIVPFNITASYNNGFTTTTCNGQLTVNPNPSCNLNVGLSANASVAKTGDTVTFTATVDNPDNLSLSWTWNWGDGTTSTAPGPSNTHLYSQIKDDGSGNPIPYTVTITLTGQPGNCTATATTKVTVKAGVKRINRPGYGVGGCFPDVFTGNAVFFIPDPVPTRGYPLANNIYLNTQSVEDGVTRNGVTLPARLLGNATFTYDIHVVADTYNTFNQNRWTLVDGTGKRHDFGLASGNPTPEAGVFSTLTKNGNGTFTLTAAGPPGAIEMAGNFRYDFDTNGRLTKITDPAANTQTLAYSGTKLSTVTDDNTGKKITFDTSQFGRVVIKQNGNGQSITVFVSSNRVTDVEVKDIAGVVMTRWHVDYYSTGLIKSWYRDNDTRSTITYTYTAMPSVFGVASVPIYLANQSDALGQTRYIWGRVPQAGAADTVKVTNNKGGEFLYDFNSLGDEIKETWPVLVGGTAAPVFTFSYYANRLVQTVSDGLNSIGFTYTAKGLPSTLTSVGRTWTWNWAGTNSADLQSVSDPVSNPLVSFGYHATLTHVPVSATDALNNIWTFGLEQYLGITYGQVKTITPPGVNPSLGVLTATYDETAGSSSLGYPLSLGIVKNNTTTDYVTFDAYSVLGDLTQFSTYPVNGNTSIKNSTIMGYDGLQRLKTLVQPNGKTASWTYQNGGRFLSQTTDENLVQFNYTFCPVCDGLESVSGPHGWSLRWKDDGDRDVVRFTDARAKTTLYKFGAAGEPLGVIYPDGSSTSLSYDNYGRVKKVGYGNSQVYWSYTLNYDTKNRVSSMAGPNTLTFNYYDDDTLLSHDNNVGTVSYVYNDDGSVEHVTYNFGEWGLASAQTVYYTYYPDGSRATMRWENGTTLVCEWSYSYDQAGRLTGVTNSFGESTGWTYDGEGKLTRQSNANGTRTDYTYSGDAGKRGWPDSIATYRTGTPSTIAKYWLCYDQNLDGVPLNTSGTLPRSANGSATGCRRVL